MWRQPFPPSIILFSQNMEGVMVEGWRAQWSPFIWEVSDLYPSLAPSPSARVAAEVTGGGRYFTLMQDENSKALRSPNCSFCQGFSSVQSPQRQPVSILSHISLQSTQTIIRLHLKCSSSPHITAELLPD